MTQRFSAGLNVQDAFGFSKLAARCDRRNFLSATARALENEETKYDGVDGRTCRRQRDERVKVLGLMGEAPLIAQPPPSDAGLYASCRLVVGREREAARARDFLDVARPTRVALTQ